MVVPDFGAMVAQCMRYDYANRANGTGFTHILGAFYLFVCFF